MKTNLYALSGPMNSGKNTAAKMLQYCLSVPKFMRHYWIYRILQNFPFSKWKIISFAYPLKKCLSAILNVPLNNFEDRKFKDSTYVNMNTLTLSKVSKNKLNDNQFNKAIKNQNWELLASSKLTIRQLMQYFGTTIMPKYFGENVWINSTLTHTGNFIISDVRFRKEAGEIHKLNGKIILIEREHVTPLTNHISEKEWITMKENNLYDYVINNNTSLKELFNNIKNIIA